MGRVAAKQRRDDRPRWLAVTLAATVPFALAGAFLAAGGGPLLAGDGRPWLGRALTSDGFVKAGLIAVACGGILVWLGAAMWKLAGRARFRRKADDGSVLVELTLLLPFALMVALGMLQASLLMGANICVHYSAFCAARAAVVQIPRDVSFAEPYNVLSTGIDGGKFDRIRTAAIWPLVPISYGGEDQDPAAAANLAANLRRFYRAYGRDAPGWLDERLARKVAYADEHTRLEIVPPEENRPAYRPREEIHVRVDHTFYLSVPYAGWGFWRFSDDAERLGPGEYGLVISALCTLHNEGLQDWIEVETFGGGGGAD